MQVSNILIESYLIIFLPFIEYMYINFQVCLVLKKVIKTWVCLDYKLNAEKNKLVLFAELIDTRLRNQRSQLMRL